MATELKIAKAEATEAQRAYDAAKEAGEKKATLDKLRKAVRVAKRKLRRVENRTNKPKAATKPKSDATKRSKRSMAQRMLGNVDAIMADRKVSLFQVTFTKADGSSRTMLALKPKAAIEAGLVQPPKGDDEQINPDLHTVISLDVQQQLVEDGLSPEDAAARSWRHFYGSRVTAIRSIA